VCQDFAEVGRATLGFVELDDLHGFRGAAHAFGLRMTAHGNVDPVWRGRFGWGSDDDRNQLGCNFWLRRECSWWRRPKLDAQQHACSDWLAVALRRLEVVLERSLTRSLIEPEANRLDHFGLADLASNVDENAQHDRGFGLAGGFGFFRKRRLRSINQRRWCSFWLRGGLRWWLGWRRSFLRKRRTTRSR
jgi:hypothetical protein